MLKRSWIIILFYGDQNGTLNNHCLDGIKSNIYVLKCNSKIILKVMLSSSKWPQIHPCYYILLLLIHRFQIAYSHILNSTNSPLHYIVSISHLFKWLHIIVHCATESKFKSKCQLLSCVQLFVTPWTVALQAPLSMGFSRQEYGSGLSFPSPGNLCNLGTEPGSPALQVDSLLLELLS